MGAQVKDFVFLVELSLIPFSFIFEIQQSVQVILIVSFVSSGVQKGVDNSSLQETGYSYIFSTQFFLKILSEGTAKFILGLFN